MFFANSSSELKLLESADFNADELAKNTDTNDLIPLEQVCYETLYQKISFCFFGWPAINDVYISIASGV